MLPGDVAKIQVCSLFWIMKTTSCNLMSRYLRLKTSAHDVCFTKEDRQVCYAFHLAFLAIWTLTLQQKGSWEAQGQPSLPLAKWCPRITSRTTQPSTSPNTVPLVWHMCPIFFPVLVCSAHQVTQMTGASSQASLCLRGSEELHPIITGLCSNVFMFLFLFKALSYFVRRVMN